MIQYSLHFTCVQRAPSFRIQKQLLQTTLAAARLRSCRSCWTTTKQIINLWPASWSVVWGEYTETRARAKLSRQLIIVFKYRTQEPDEAPGLVEAPKWSWGHADNQRAQLWNTSSSSMEISLHRTCHIKQLPKGGGRSKNVICFSLLHV